MRAEFEQDQLQVSKTHRKNSKSALANFTSIKLHKKSQKLKDEDLINVPEKKLKTEDLINVPDNYHELREKINMEKTNKTQKIKLLPDKSARKQLEKQLVSSPCHFDLGVDK